MASLAISSEWDQLEMHLQSRLSGHIRNLTLEYRDGGLVLRGQAHTYYAKQMAQHALMQATQVPIRANEILVT